jgi:hypothetical protein
MKKKEEIELIDLDQVEGTPPLLEEPEPASFNLNSVEARTIEQVTRPISYRFSSGTAGSGRTTPTRTLSPADIQWWGGPEPEPEPSPILSDNDLPF